MEQRTERGCPVADWLDPAAMSADPYPTYDRLRELGPVVYAPALGRYLVTTHEAVSSAEHEPEIFSSQSNTNLTMLRALGARPMLRKDDPEHAEERAAMNPSLRPRVVATQWSPNFAANVDHWLDHMIDIGPLKADLNEHFAAPVASQNLIDLLGFPAEVGAYDMHRWSTDFIAGIGNLGDDDDIWSRCDTSAEEVTNVLDALLPHLRTSPDHSITSHLLEAGLSDDQVRANVHLTISGGMNEPQHIMTSTVWALGEHADQLAAAIGGGVDWGVVFEEVIRWQSPIGMLPRETTQATSFFGAQIPAMANVGLLVACANRDGNRFAHPADFDVARSARGHLGFGNGTHMCPGRWAAKAGIGEIAIPELYRRIPRLRVDKSRPVTWDGWVFRGLTTLPVTWDS